MASKSHCKHSMNGSAIEIILSTVFIVADINYFRRPDMMKDIVPSKYFIDMIHCGLQNVRF